uniref:Uncharacterized protein n=1 Tax=Arundo donax TaxID=35708 RepID=A0A0A9GHJ2_ARUDO
MARQPTTSLLIVPTGQPPDLSSTCRPCWPCSHCSSEMACCMYLHDLW